jgi:2-hydroxy-3-keto-5-methylthiopentenyl-1-phosphate phosphatase
LLAQPGPAVRAVVLDFDGAICPADVTEALLRTFGDPAWWRIEEAMRSGELSLRGALVRQAALLRGDPDEWLSYAVSEHPLDPTFEPFVRRARGEGIRLAVASDGLGFYIEPMLAAAGIDGIEVRANRFAAVNGDMRLSFPEANAVCVGCGTCKMQVVTRYRERYGKTAFVGEGYSDRYGTVFADVTFAKRHLAELCASTGIPFTPWETYGDVWNGLASRTESDLATAGGRRFPDRCPGWTEGR